MQKQLKRDRMSQTSSTPVCFFLLLCSVVALTTLWNLQSKILIHYFTADKCNLPYCRRSSRFPCLKSFAWRTEIRWKVLFISGQTLVVPWCRPSCEEASLYTLRIMPQLLYVHKCSCLMHLQYKGVYQWVIHLQTGKYVDTSVEEMYLSVVSMEWDSHIFWPCLPY